MDFVFSELTMILLFTVIPLAVLVIVIVYIRNWMVKQTKLKEEQNRLLNKIADKLK
ncbi:hypothetical protein [Pedobacter psychrophilus]|uniref:hypothetical protein n=1 Tax=Pedobacter psychrophilus TaxID=1826909 RepID=UPI000AD75335|nr:hypothetical protein [Pedobacter psychrophilus]